MVHRLPSLNTKKALAAFCLLVFTISVWIGVSKHERHHYEYTIGYDSEGYYLYLPAVFIHHGLDNLRVQNENNNPHLYAYKAYPGTNKVFTKYTYGVALMEAPFFLAAHAYTLNQPHSAYTDNYFLDAYMVSIIVADAFYLSLGMFILGLLLLRYFSLTVVLATELIIWLGTNLVFYTSFVPGLSHVCSFFLISALVALVPTIYKHWKIWHLILAASLTGLIGIIRPTNLVILLYFLLYDVYSRDNAKSRILLLLSKWKKLIVFPVEIFVFAIPQLLYWHYISGHFVLYSYQDEGFIYWSHPKMLQVLFDPQNGFFLYAPLMLLSMAGLVYIISQKAQSGISILLIFVLTDYICGSWWYWNFGGAYGFRPYIDFMGLLAIPLAAFLSLTSKWKISARLTYAVIIVFFIFLNIRLQQIYIYPWEGPNWGWDDIIRVHKEALFIK